MRRRGRMCHRDTETQRKEREGRAVVVICRMGHCGTFWDICGASLGGALGVCEDGRGSPRFFSEWGIVGNFGEFGGVAARRGESPSTKAKPTGCVFG